ncbi:MAG: glycosyltransferase [Bifidobacteriaceae bacterium]|nr:glycosyltransferase [Bifidobacteriaceae bacterium]
MPNQSASHAKPVASAPLAPGTPKAEALAVVAVVATRGRSEYLPRALVALAAQTTRPTAVVVVDAGARSDPAIAEMAIRCGIPREILTVVHAVRAKNFGQAVAAGLLGRDTGALIWLLHDDSYPEPDCLANLMVRAELSPSVAVVGPKQVQAEDPARLGEVGVTTTPFGRRLPYGQEGELDQGQYDGLEDVLAVGSAGMLVRSEVWSSLGGFTPALGPFRDGLEFCRRARLAGFRVAVEPTAVIGHEQATYRGLRDTDRRGRPLPPSTRRSYGARRRAFIFSELVDAPLWALLPIGLVAVLAGLGRFFWRIAAKDFRLAVAEITAPLAVVTRADAVARARYVAHRTRRSPRRMLAPLEISVAEARQARRDRRLTEAELRRQALAPTEIEMAEHRELASRRRRMVGFVIAAALAVTAAALYRLAGPGAVLGGALGLQDASPVDLARIASGGWLREGLGEAGPGDPFSAVLALVTLLCLGDGGTAVKALLLAIPLLAALGAWFAAGAAARSVWIRAWVALFYLAAPSLWTALSDGRLGAATAHVALPWALLGAARAIGVNRLDVRPAVVDADGNVTAPAALEHGGSLAAAAFGGLAFTLVAAGSPALLPAGLVAVAVLFVIAGRGRRLRLVWLVLPALALFAPLLARALADGQWRSLLAGPGLVAGYEPAAFWLQLLGWPSQPVLPAVVPGSLVEAVAAATTLGLFLAAVVALFRTGPAARGVRFGWFLALIGGAVLFGLDRLAVSVSGLEPVRAWPGGACALILAGLSLAAAVGLSGLVGEVGGRARPARAGLAAVGVIVLVVGPLAGAAIDVWQRLTVSEVRRVASAPMPPIVAAEADSARATYALNVATAEGSVLAWDLVRGSGHQIWEAEGLVSSRRLAGLPGSVGPLDAADQAVGELLAGIYARNPGDASLRLALFGVGFVLADPAEFALGAAFDATPGLTRVREGDGGAVVWQVSPEGFEGTDGATVDAAGRLHVVGPDGAATALAAGASTSLRADLANGTDGRRLILAERTDSRWRATLNGQALAAAQTDEWYQSFELPAGSGQLRVWYDQPSVFGWVQAGVLVLALLLALPLRSAGRPAKEEN